MEGFFERFQNGLFDFPELFVQPKDLLYWKYILLNFALALIVALLFTSKKTNIVRIFRAHLKSKRMRKELSLDIKFFVFKILHQPLKIALLTPLFLGVASYMTALGDRTGYEVSESPLLVMSGASGFLFKWLAILLVYDLSSYLYHYLAHRWEPLWKLHSVHHRATYMTPLTKYRVHPFDLIVDNLSWFVIASFFVGAFDRLVLLEGSRADNNFYYLMILFFAHHAFGHIRHSHFWISYGPLSYVLMSPAMHQIHHSTDPKHFGKNLSVMFSVWDLVFGTLYIPKKKEILKFGVSEAARTEEKTFWGELWIPVKDSCAALLPQTMASPRPPSLEKKTEAFESRVGVIKEEKIG